jgi:hypothetical protein
LVKVVIKKIAPDTSTQALLFVGAKQDTVNQTTGNGETLHQDVFRKSLSLIDGDGINLPINVNDSSISIYSYKVDATWITNRMQTISILQNSSNKSVINSSESVNIVSSPLSVSSIKTDEIFIYPNPSNDYLIIKNAQQLTNYEIITFTGNVIQKGVVVNEKISVKNITNGQYILKLNFPIKNYIQKISIQK